MEFENKSRDITALELADIMKDFGDKINDYEFSAFIYSLLQKEFFPLLCANMPNNWQEFRTLAATMATTITVERLGEFAAHNTDILGVYNAARIAALVDTLIFDNNDSFHINNKEVN